MKNLQALASDLAANQMILLVSDDMLNIKGGTGYRGGSKKNKSKKNKSKKSKKNTGGYRGHSHNSYCRH
jgi:hypothetical protein